MSALTFTLLFFICVCCYVIKVNGMQNQRYPTRMEHKHWRFGKRQDQISQPRFFLWKSALTPGQMYPNSKTPVLPLNYNRYGMPPIHQSYMFAIPTKVNYPPYQPLKEIDEKRKPGNLHHITIINAIIPKPYVPTPPTYSHPTTTFRNYRNNKLLFPQSFNNNYGRQNMENFNKIKTQQQHFQKQQLQKPVVYQNLQNTLPAALMVNNKPTMEYINLISYTTSNSHENKINNATIANCGRKAKEDTTNIANSVLYYYCNNRILDYKNPSENYIEPTQPVTPSTTKSTTTSTKSSRLDLEFYTTEKSIFLPTPNTPVGSSSGTVVFTTPRKANEIEYAFVPTRPTYDTKYDGIKLQQQRHITKIYDSFKRQQQQLRHTTTTYDDMQGQQQRYTSTKYDDMKRQRYTTSSYDDMKLHSFFTIEDAVTSAPQMHVFNDPYQAYRHARKHHNYHQRQTTTTKLPIVTTTTKKSTLRSFFDDLVDEDYVTPEPHQYDYNFYGQPQKSANQEAKNENGLKLPTHNPIVDHTHKPEIGDSLFGESYQGKPKIKKHNFGILEAITPSTYVAPIITTYKPNENLNDITTQKSYTSKPATYSTTTEMGLKNIVPETSTPEVTSDHHVATTTYTTKTIIEKKAKRIPTKSLLNLRTTVSFKYPKHRSFYKPIKNITTSTSSTPTSPYKKATKYQRQYKGKKLKQFKHLYTTLSSTTTTTTTTSPKIEEYHTKRDPSRTLSATSTTEAATTRKIISRTSPLNENTNPRKVSPRLPSTVESNKKASSRTLSSTEASSAKKEAIRRGITRANKIKQKEEPPVQTTKRKHQNKRRRRPQTTSTTTKPISANFPSTSIYSYSLTSTPATTTSRTSSTTMKSIMRIANSKSKSQVQNDNKPNVKFSNELYDDLLTSDDRASLKSITSSMAKDGTVPSLPIEIYFKKSQIAKI